MPATRSPSNRRPHLRAPIRQQIVEHRIQPFRRRLPRLEQIVIEPDLVDRGDGRLGVGVRGEQHLPRVGIQLDRLDEELRPGHLRHALVDEEERDRRAALLELAGRLERLAAGPDLDHPVVGAKMLAQVAFDRIQNLGVVVDGEDDRFRHEVNMERNWRNGETGERTKPPKAETGERRNWRKAKLANGETASGETGESETAKGETGEGRDRRTARRRVPRPRLVGGNVVVTAMGWWHATHLLRAYWHMSPRRPLRVIDAAEAFAADVHRCFNGPGRPKTYADQATRAAASVYANLKEGFGRGPGRIECGSTGTLAPRARKRSVGSDSRISVDELATRKFHRLMNRGVAIIRMIRRLRY